MWFSNKIWYLLPNGIPIYFCWNSEMNKVTQPAETNLYSPSLHCSSSQMDSCRMFCYPVCSGMHACCRTRRCLKRTRWYLNKNHVFICLLARACMDQTEYPLRHCMPWIWNIPQLDIHIFINQEGHISSTNQSVTKTHLCSPSLHRLPIHLGNSHISYCRPSLCTSSCCRIHRCS